MQSKPSCSQAMPSLPLSGMYFRERPAGALRVAVGLRGRVCTPPPHTAVRRRWAGTAREEHS